MDAIGRPQAFDYLFVYNDDVRLDKSAIADLVKSSLALMERRAEPCHHGLLLQRRWRATTYGGRRRSSRWHPLKFAHLVEPDGTLKRADAEHERGLDFAIGPVPRRGFFSDYFVHSGADFEFGLKLRKAGGRCSFRNGISADAISTRRRTPCPSIRGP